MTTPPLLEVAGLKKHFPVRKGVLSQIVGYVYAVAAVWIVGRILDRRSTTHTDVANAEVPHG